MPAARVTLALVALLAAGALVQTSASAGPAGIVAWPGSSVTYRDQSHRSGYHRAIKAAVAAWNRTGFGARLVPSGRRADVTIAVGGGRCLLRRAGTASAGFRVSGAVVRVARSCPRIVRPLLVAHELGRVLGLPNDDSHCSLMNSHATSDGFSYVVPAKCSRTHPPSWLRALVDPGSDTLAHTIYTPPLPTGSIDLAVDSQGVPTVTWTEPDDSRATWTIVARERIRCPDDRAVAAGIATLVYDAAAATGSHSVVDSSFPQAGETDCYAAFRLNEYGRMAASPDAISYTFGGPIAGFTVAAPPIAGTPTTFEDTSRGPSSSVVHWHWDFGDPKSGTDVIDTSDPALGRQVAHTYAAAGTYVVTLTVTDGAGRSSTMLQRIAVGAA